MTPASYHGNDPVDRYRLPIDEWRIIETRTTPESRGAMESVFAVGNGYLGLRGTPEEGREVDSHGTFVNGFHETWPIQHAENAFGFAKVGQTIVNAPDATVIKLYVNDEPLTVETADLQEYSREMDLREGVLHRNLLWRTPSGLHVQVRSTRMASFTDRHVAVMTFEVTLLDGDAPVVISSQILNRQDGRTEYAATEDKESADFDPRRASAFGERVLVPVDQWHSDRRLMLGYHTARSDMRIAVAADHDVTTGDPLEVLTSVEGDRARQVFRVRASQGTTLTLTKVIAYHTANTVPIPELFDRCRRSLDRVRDTGVEHVAEVQRAWLADFWRHTDVRIEGQPAIQQATRWCLFQIAQAAARADQLGIAAKGVTGSGYEGHAFWDTEVYVIPMLAYTNPVMARNALRFRVNLLDSARRRAVELSQRGALFPWRTINGEEASAYYAAGTAQYHINADIVWAFTLYGMVSGDTDFLFRDGAAVFAETARMWADLGFWANDGTFQIHGVTGPDEYTTVVNNNLFTNVMARHNLVAAARLLDLMREQDPTRFAELSHRIGLSAGEIDEWRRCAAGMYVPYDERLGIHPQDQHFLEREVWDLPRTPPNKRPLLLHYHPLVIYRFQVLKQADVVLSLFLRSEDFTAEQKRADFDYYDPITTGDSTLSAVVQSIIASEVGYDQLALDYFRSGLFVDLADTHRNTRDGVHIASAGGVWNSLVFGFGGLRERNGVLHFDPRLPAEWTALEYPLRFQERELVVRLEQTSLTLTLQHGEALGVQVCGEDVLIGSEPVTVVLPDQGPRLPWGATVAD